MVRKIKRNGFVFLGLQRTPGVWRRELSIIFIIQKFSFFLNRIIAFSLAFFLFLMPLSTSAASLPECLSNVILVFPEGLSEQSNLFDDIEKETKNGGALFPLLQRYSDLGSDGPKMKKAYHAQQRCVVAQAFSDSQKALDQAYALTSGDGQTQSQAQYAVPGECGSVGAPFLSAFREKERKKTPTSPRLGAVPTQVLAQQLDFEYLVFQCYYTRAAFPRFLPLVNEYQMNKKNDDMIAAMVKQDLKSARQTVDDVLAAYDHFALSYTLHVGFTKVINQIVEWKKNLKPLASQLGCFPGKFVNSAKGQ